MSGGEKESTSQGVAALEASFKYRSDIDGLRAVAVTPVVLYHAGFTAVSGGYVGVDVFFVISGYLITLIIHGEMRDRRFSIINFYERRVRRIMPALLFLIATVTAASLTILLPSELREYGLTAAGTILFVSNLIFWWRTDYFGPAAEQTPLLHTWSLGVEEQFYIFFPLLLFLLVRFSPRLLTATLAGLALVSFAACVWLTLTGHAPAAFYFLPMRGWELMLGALLAVGALPPLRGVAVKNVLALIGLGMMCTAFFLLDASTPFPGYAALLPAMGATLSIYAAEGTVSGRLLSLRPFVFVGLISYSLYLWHWPLLVFARMVGWSVDGGWHSLVLVLISGLLATASWRYVERPFRSRQRIARNSAFLLAAGGAAILTLVCGSFYTSRGWEWRFSPEAVAMDRGRKDFSPMRASCHRGSGLPDPARACIFGRPPAATVVWADSHGVELSYALGERAPTVSMTFSGCPPAFGFSPEGQRLCARYNENAARYLAANGNIRTVIMAARMEIYRDNPQFFAGFRRAVEAMRHAGKRVIVIGPTPGPGVDVPTYLGRGNGRSVSLSAFHAQLPDVYSFLVELQSTGAEVFWPENYLCQENRCELVIGGTPIMFDNNHMSMTTARLLAQRLAVP